MAAIESPKFLIRVRISTPLPKIVSERVAVNGDQPALKTGAAGNGTGSTPALSAKIILR